jgi:hypothetical protein
VEVNHRADIRIVIQGTLSVSEVLKFKLFLRHVTIFSVFIFQLTVLKYIYIYIILNIFIQGDKKSLCALMITIKKHAKNILKVFYNHHDNVVRIMDVDEDVDVDWGRGHGATTPLHLGLYLQALCAPPFSYARHLQRRSPSCDMRDPYQRRMELRARNGR